MNIFFMSRSTRMLEFSIKNKMVLWYIMVLKRLSECVWFHVRAKRPFNHFSWSIFSQMMAHGTFKQELWLCCNGCDTGEKNHLSCFFSLLDEWFVIGCKISFSCSMGVRSTAILFKIDSIRIITHLTAMWSIQIEFFKEISLHYASRSFQFLRI